MEQSVWTFRRGKGMCYHVPFPCMELFMYLGYKKLVSWLMSWVSLKAFPNIPPRRVSQDPSRYFRSLEGSEEWWRVGSCCHPGTVCSSAEAGVQRRRLARFLRAWLSTEESAAEGVISWWAAAAVTSRAPSMYLQSGKFFYVLWAPKGHRAGRGGCSNSSAISTLW